MTPEMWRALIGAVATVLAVVVAAWLTLLRELSKQRTERAHQRDAIRNAVDAEVTRVREILLQQLKWLVEKPTNLLNWLPIHTQVWDGLAAQIGSLEPKEAGDLTRFFGSVRWSNEVLTLRDGAFKGKDQEFLKTYQVALQSVAKSLPSRFITDEIRAKLSA